MVHRRGGGGGEDWAVVRREWRQQRAGGERAGACRVLAGLARDRLLVRVALSARPGPLPFLGLALISPRAPPIVRVPFVATCHPPSPPTLKWSQIQASARPSLTVRHFMCVLAPYPDPAHLYRDLPHPASLSRPFDAAERPPRLFHSLRQERNSVLSLAADPSHLFSGGPTGDISVRPPCLCAASSTDPSSQVWCKETLKLKTILRGHTGSILALEYAADKEWLFSASGASSACFCHPHQCPEYVCVSQVTAQFAYVRLAFASCSASHRVPC